MAEKKLEVKDLRISFRTPDGKVQAVRNISFDLYKGETLAIVGESGSGKSVTNRAIIGISAGNAIVESGEILYDGQDLLKISEEDFHKIRGDKIAMIFQDPMSSLNPIMRVGKQLTEAMILKGRTTQKRSRVEFNEKLTLLTKNMVEKATTPEEQEVAENKCKTFNDFCVIATEKERVYNNKVTILADFRHELKNILFLLSKEQKVNFAKIMATAKKAIKDAEHPFLFTKDETATILAKLDEISKKYEKTVKSIDKEDYDYLTDLSAKTRVLYHREQPNFFRLGYYLYKNPNDESIWNTPIPELNAKLREYLDNNFMLDFIPSSEVGIKNAWEKSLEAKKALIPELDKAIEFYSKPGFDASISNKLFKDLSNKVIDAINHLEIVKRSEEYSFKPALSSALKKHAAGIRTIPKEQRRYDRQMAKYNALVNKGKTPDWKVVPPAIYDLNLSCGNICLIIQRLKECYLREFQDYESFDSNKVAIELIDFLKEKADSFVSRVTPSMAKRRALKLLEEVGISEPERRYKQYPFEFSGGMRQRIVIAIALAANPDILICDEPTTALDVTIQSQILELINKLKRERNLSIIFITHDLGVVANMADRIAVMYAGKIVETGTSNDVFYSPAHPYTWALLSSMPDLDTKEKLEAIPGTPPNMIYPPKGDAFAERNAHALKIDFIEEPPLFKISDTHYAATWLLHPDAPKVEPPKIVTERIKRMKARRESK